MANVAGHDECQRPDRNGRVARRTFERPIGTLQAVKHDQISAPKQVEFIQKRGQVHAVRSAVPYVYVLVKTRKRCRVAMRKAERAIAEDPFSVVNVPNQLLDRPLAFFVGMFRLSLRSIRKEFADLARLGGEHGKYVGLWNKFDITVVKWRIFRSLWPVHSVILAERRYRVRETAAVYRPVLRTKNSEEIK